MRIIFEFDKHDKVIKETTAETIHEVLDEIADLLVAYSFASRTVEDGIIAKAEEIEELRSKNENRA